MLHCMDAWESMKGDGKGPNRCGRRAPLRSIIKRSGPYFGDHAMLWTDNHQAWRLSERLTTHGT